MTYRLNDVFTAIADSNRRQIIGILAKNEMSVSDLSKNFDVSRPAISKHLKVLQNSNLVYSDQIGRERIYKLNPEPLKEVNEWIAEFNKFWDEKLENLKTIAEKGE